MKRGTSSQTVIGRKAQVDLCPAEGGMVISVGRLSIWLERAEAEDLVATLETALMLSGRAAKARPAAGDSPPAVRRRDVAVS